MATIHNDGRAERLKILASQRLYCVLMQPGYTWPGDLSFASPTTDGVLGIVPVSNQFICTAVASLSSGEAGVTVVSGGATPQTTIYKFYSSSASIGNVAGLRLYLDFEVSSLMFNNAPNTAINGIFIVSNLSIKESYSSGVGGFIPKAPSIATNTTYTIQVAHSFADQTGGAINITSGQSKKLQLVIQI
jgi:hypothetical protein